MSGKVGASPRPHSVDRAPAPAKNFIAKNRLAAAEKPPRSASEASGRSRAPSNTDRRYSRDESNVPVYLQRVKAAVEAEKQYIASKLGLDKVDDGAPPGHRWLQGAEKLEVLAQLHARKAELDRQRDCMTLNVRTEAQRRRASELESALRQVERAIETFSRPCILVKE